MKEIRNLIFLLNCFLLTNLSFCQTKELDEFYNSDFQPKELNEFAADRINDLFKIYSRKNDTSSIDIKDFVYGYNYFLENLNRSGDVFFGDQISSYLNQLKDFLLEGHPEKNNIKVYCTKYPYINAFTNDFGSIYFNIGTIAKLNTEEELLAIMAHEINHILLQHSYKSEVLSNDLSDNKLGEDAKAFKKHSFSRENEFDADLNGFILLKKRNVDLNLSIKAFDVLNRGIDLPKSAKFSSKIWSGDTKYFNDFLDSSYMNSGQLYKNISIAENDSLSTHPSISKRITKLQNFINSNESTMVKGGYHHIGKYAYYKDLAEKILVRAYLEKGLINDGFLHVTNLRNENEKNPFLIKSQAKFMTLLVQKKYKLKPFDQFLNSTGNIFSDTTAITERELLLSMNSLEFNLLALEFVKNAMQEINDPYLDRVYSFLIQYLYKYNEGIFNYDNGKLNYISPDSINDFNVKVHDVNFFLNLTKEAKEYYDELVEDNLMVYVPVNSNKNSKKLIKQYFSQNKFGLVENKAVNQFKKNRKLYEKTLTHERFQISLDPYKAIEKYRRGEFEKANDFDPKGKVSLMQSDNYYLKEKRSGYVMDYKKSLNLERMMHAILDTSTLFEKNYSNLNVANNLSIKGNSKHNILNTWVDERFEFDDLNYSKVDEEVQRILKDETVRYLLYNINISTNERSWFSPYRSISYSIYFDIINQGIAYVSKNSSKQKGNAQLFRHYFYMSKDFLNE